MFEEWQNALIDARRVAHLGTIAPDGRPHLVPVCFARLDDAFAIAVDEKPKRPGELARLKNLRRDPRATLLFDRYDDDWARLGWVRVEGSALVLERGSEQPAALQALRERYRQYRSMNLEGLPLIIVRPGRVVGWRWSG